MKRLALLLLLPLAAAADASDAPPQDPELIPGDNAATVQATMLALGEIDRRLTVPVALGTSGPFHFIIDTGAERTVVSRELAGSLQLAPGDPVTLTSMTGVSEVDTVIVPQLAIKSIGETHKIVAPALYARNLGAMGLLGIDTLQKHQVTIDFEHGTMAVRPSVKRNRFARRNRNEIVVTAKNVFGQLIVTDAYYGRTRIQVVIDTGSQVTMGNSALRRKIGRHLEKPRMIELTSVTGEKTVAPYTRVPDIRVGGVLFGDMPIAFADVAPFERFGLTRRPALLMGMDTLRSFLRVDIDFPNRQVRFVVPESARDRERHTGSLIPGVRGNSPSSNY